VIGLVGGAVVLNASVVPVQGVPSFSVYSASKVAVRSFARGWTNDLRDFKIRVNVLSPGPIEALGRVTPFLWEITRD
jgi:NAD(P)-dependent dehydrogenase (short-subunit alcohol dehydrogenase family)